MNKWDHFVNRPPSGLYRMLQERADRALYQHKITKMTIIVSVATEKDGFRWIHLSCAYPHKTPTYSELKKVKNHIIGENKTAYLVFPSTKRNINIHNFCLHMFCCFDRDVYLPDFIHGGNTL